jgi:hypothetical protein
MGDIFLNNEGLVITCLLLSVLRVLLEVFKFKLKDLPLSRALSRNLGKSMGEKIHKIGLYLSVGYILLFSPTYLLS